MRERRLRSLTGPLSEIASDTATIIFVNQAVIISQKYLFPQDLAMHQEDTANEENQQDPSGKDQELAEEDKPESEINGIACDFEDSGGDEFVRVVLIDAHAKAASK